MLFSNKISLAGDTDNIICSSSEFSQGWYCFFFSKYSSCLESVNSICLLWSIIFIGGYWQNLVAKNYEKLIILPPNYYMNEFITLLVPSLGRQSEANFWVQGQHDLQSSFRKFRTTQKKNVSQPKKERKNKEIKFTPLAIHEHKI